MTIERGIGGTGKAADQQQTKDNNFNAFQEQPTEQVNKRFALSNLGKIGNLPMSRRSGSEVAVELANAMDELMEKYKLSSNISTLIIEPKNADNLFYTAVAVIHSIPEKKCLAYHLLLVAGSSESSGAPLVENVPNYGTIETRITPGCGINSRTITSVSEYIRSRTGLVPHYASSCTVPTQFPIKEQSNVYRLLANAVTAASSVLNIRSGMPDLNLGECSFDTQLSIRVSAMEDHLVGADSLPIRSDLCVEILSQPLRNNGGSPESNLLARAASEGVGATAITQLTGYVDLISAPADNVGNAAFGLMKPTQALRPRIMITDFQAVDNVTSNLQLLALVSAKKLTEGFSWSGAFSTQRRPLNKNEIDFRNIGAIGYVLETLPGNMPGGVPVDTSPDKFNAQILRVLLNHAVFPDPVVTLLIDEAGPQTWINSIFLAAARNVPDAVKALIAHCNLLTNGNFNKYYDPQKPLVTTEDNRIHAGVWRDPQDRQRDLLEFDLLAAMNFYGKAGDLDAIHTFADSYVDTNIPLKVRLDRRWNLIQGALGPSVRHTGFKRPVNILPNMLTSLVKGVADCGLEMNSIFNLGETMGSLQRASLNITGLTFGADASSLFAGSSGGLNTNTGNLGMGNFSQVVW